MRILLKTFFFFLISLIILFFSSAGTSQAALAPVVRMRSHWNYRGWRLKEPWQMWIAGMSTARTWRQLPSRRGFPSGCWCILSVMYPPRFQAPLFMLLLAPYVSISIGPAFMIPFFATCNCKIKLREL